MGSQSYAIPPLFSGGIMLTYRCSSTCRHCLYKCSPKQPDDWMTLETATKVLDALTHEPHLESLHLAGGEATLRMDLLVAIIELIVERNLPLAYLETNAAWCTEPTVTHEKMCRLRDAGLPALLVSCSLFHNEHIPFGRTRLAVETARDVFGPENVIVWQPHFFHFLDSVNARTLSLEESTAMYGIGGQEVVASYQVVPGGRAPQGLRDYYTAHPPEAFEGKNCRGELRSTSHFHIDAHGNLFTGLCAGLAPATADTLHPAITPEAHPVFCALHDEGPVGLMRHAQERCGFEERAEGYVSKCDLCLHVRTHLHATGDYPELRPAAFYTND